MSKKCIICGDHAVYIIKDSSDFYCPNCATENFSDVELLEKIENRAKTLKKMIDEHSDMLNEVNQEEE